MADERTVDGFWFVWIETADWPSLFYDREKARVDAITKARTNPGRYVYWGSLDQKERLLLSDKVDVMQIS